jgi:hypothetical protein
MRRDGRDVKMLGIFTHAPGETATRFAHQPIGAGP